MHHSHDISGNEPVCQNVVCAWVQKVVGLKTPNMIASGTMIAPNFILTNHHVVEDHAVIAVRMASGDIRSARPILHVVAFDR